MCPWSRVLLVFTVVSIASAQTASTIAVASSDPSSLKLVQSSFAAMGGVVPVDSTETGIVVVIAGSQTQSGTFRHLTRSSDQTSEDIALPDGDRKKVFSRGAGLQAVGTTTAANSAQWAATAESADLPIVLIGQLLQDPATVWTPSADTVVEGTPSHCVIVSKNYSDSKQQSSLAAVSKRTMCFNASTNLPTSVSFVSRTAEGAVAGVAVELHFSDYRNQSGILVPFSIHQYLNGTPWAVISMQNIAFNTGLTDADFATE